VDVPFSSTPRPDTGVTNPQLGLWLFLSSEVMLFGSLFSAYAILRSGADTWPDQSTTLNVPLGSVNTVLLLASSVAMALVGPELRSLRFVHGRSRFHRARAYAIVAMLCGVLFLGIKGLEYSGEIARGLVPATNNFLGLYYAMTALHSLHLLGGVLALAYIWGPGARVWKTDPQRFTVRASVVATYWQFVDAVWLCLFVVLYLL
jgi:cytochrome c oxidase subunit III